MMIAYMNGVVCLFFDGIIGLINGKEGAEQKCVQILEIFQLLNCKTIHHMFQTYLEAIKHKLP